MAKSPTATCAICGKPQVARYRPFCSARCADVDLHRWLGGGYGIPAADPELEDEPGPPLSGPRRDN
ncbi:DNA gyrase inhibitor YacG [Zavarzinia sp. CC-PAN008]|uniref:DNA gyrase inhibitor YacG n=1 Tax=Zavarzinia sp. CC-PAN008 TaxID=3243332 RepID=UPI003F7472C9